MPEDYAFLFLENYIRQKPINWRKIPESGSERINFIGEYKNKKYVVTYNKNREENEAFFYFSNLFAQHKINVPEILDIHPKKDLYIQSFVGEDTLLGIILKEGYTEKTKLLVKKTLQQLFETQHKILNCIDYSKAYKYKNYDNIPILDDLHYFKKFFIDLLGLHYDKYALVKDFYNLANKIENLLPRTIMLRDFQSRNIVINTEQDIFFIDYQSAMEGPAVYDLISFLFQAKANFPQNWKEEMLSYYTSLWQESYHKDLQESFSYCQLIRFLQVLGAYGFRGIIQRKEHFLSSIYLGLENLTHFFLSWENRIYFPELYQLIQKSNKQKNLKKIETLINR